MSQTSAETIATPEPKGLGGWLILVGIGVVLIPVKIAITMVLTYKPIFSGDTWTQLTDPSGAAYHPLWQPILLTEIIINIGLIIASIYVAYLFFTKRRAFPTWFISIVLFSFAFLIVDAFAIKLVMPSEAVFDPDTIKELARSIVGIVIWVPYMLVSRRVKNTFVA